MVVSPRIPIFIAALALCAAVSVFAQSYPARPLRLVVPYAAGGSTDVLARIIGQKLTAMLGQAVVVDNRTGAGTLIATEIVAHAAPDGYTFLMATPPLTGAPVSVTSKGTALPWSAMWKCTTTLPAPSGPEVL